MIESESIVLGDLKREITIGALTPPERRDYNGES